MPRSLESTLGAPPSPRPLPLPGAWPRLLGLWALTFIPIAAGLWRLHQLATARTYGPEDARFFAQPLPVVLHILGASVMVVLGALQFWPSLRQRRADWHVALGWLLVPAGALGALSGVWMTLYYPKPPHDGALLTVFRLVFAALFVLALFLGTRAALNRDFADHGAWMLRAYALAMGAGTQSVLLGPMTVLLGPLAPVPHALLMGAGWAINLAYAEWWLRRGVRARAS